MYLMYFPTPSSPKLIWKIPLIKKTPKMYGSACSIDPLCTLKIVAITTILTAVIGAVGPEI